MEWFGSTSLDEASRKWRWGLLATIAVVAAGCLPDMSDSGIIDYQQCEDLPPVSERPNANCQNYPHLCDRPAERVDDSSVAAGDAVHIAFVGEGFADQRPGGGYGLSYEDHVEDLVDGLVADEEGIVGSRPDDFHFHRVDLAPDPDEPNQSILEGCLEEAPTTDWLRSRDKLASLAVAQSREVEREPEIIVALFHDVDGRANADGRRRLAETSHIRMSSGDSPQVLSHELGHALIGLGDEYGNRWGDHDGCFECDETCRETHFHGTEASTLRAVPNLTIDEEGARWSDITDGVEPGGDGYDCGVYHPGHDCRMKSSSNSQFCPVCREAIDERLRGFFDEPVEPPRCRLSWRRNDAEPRSTDVSISSSTSTDGVDAEVMLTYEEVPQETTEFVEGETESIGVIPYGWTSVEVSSIEIPAATQVDDGVVVRVEAHCTDKRGQTTTDEAWFELEDGLWRATQEP